ncbi:unnamed protein product, partial [Polarella glacialis]
TVSSSHLTTQHLASDSDGGAVMPVLRLPGAAAAGALVVVLGVIRLCRSCARRRAAMSAQSTQRLVKTASDLEVPLHGSFSGNPICRETGAQHKDPAWLLQALQEEGARFLIIGAQGSGQELGRSKFGLLLQETAPDSSGVSISIPWQTASVCYA